MSQQLERQIQKPTKLSEAWRLASKELMQIKRLIGSREKRAVCAWGALEYYFGDYPELGELNACMKSDNIRRQTDLFEKRYRSPISWLNDERGWTFDYFAIAAEKMGL